MYTSKMSLQKTVADEKLKIISEKYNDDFRQTIVDYIYKKVKNKSYSIQFEKHIFNNVFQKVSLSDLRNNNLKIFDYSYNHLLKEIIINHKELKTKLKNKNISYNDIFENGTTTFDKYWSDALKRKEEEEKMNFSTKLKPNNTTTMCYKCKQKKIFVIHRQTRSADEAETIYYHCLNCNNRWVN